MTAPLKPLYCVCRACYASERVCFGDYYNNLGRVYLSRQDFTICDVSRFIRERTREIRDIFEVPEAAFESLEPKEEAQAQEAPVQKSQAKSSLPLVTREGAPTEPPTPESSANLSYGTFLPLQPEEEAQAREAPVQEAKAQSVLPLATREGAPTELPTPDPSAKPRTMRYWKETRGPFTTKVGATSIKSKATKIALDLFSILLHPMVVDIDKLNRTRGYLNHYLDYLSLCDGRVQSQDVELLKDIDWQCGLINHRCDLASDSKWPAIALVEEEYSELQILLDYFCNEAEIYQLDSNRDRSINLHQPKKLMAQEEVKNYIPMQFWDPSTQDMMTKEVVRRINLNRLFGPVFD